MPHVTALTRRVEHAARHSPFYVSCLERSLVLWWLLRWIRQPSDLQIGIRLDPERGFQAHAWLEQKERVLNDRPDIASEYLPFDDQVAPEQISRLVS